ncbi:MAG: DUF995 domain-containing protein [Mesorhizobium sp.]|nr:DUF995 domain-containing protein [Mesorhizobium sp.]
MSKTSMFSTRRVTLAVVLSAVFAFAGPSAACTEEAMPEGARPMTGVELYVLYRGKSWQWPDGAGRLQDKDRVFTAWSGSGENMAWAEGRWIVTDEGLLCLQARWHSKAGTVDDRTCFSHVTDERTIFQKRETSDEWYIFKHPEPQEGDEFKNLVRDDLVSAKLGLLRNGKQHIEQEPVPVPIVKQSMNSPVNGELQ